MTKQDYIRSLKAELLAIKRFVAMVVIFATLLSAVIGAYKGYVLISNAVQKAFEPTAEEKAEQKAAEARRAKWQKYYNRCQRNAPVGWSSYDRNAYCIKQADRITNQK